MNIKKKKIQKNKNRIIFRGWFYYVVDTDMDWDPVAE